VLGDRRAAVAAVEAWGSTAVPAAAVAFAKQLVREAGPRDANRAKALLYAASRLGAFAGPLGLGLEPEVLLAPAFVERFVAASKELSAPTKRTLRTNLRSLARAREAWPEPPPAPLPRERAKAPYTPAEISGFLALADAQPTEARRLRASALVCLSAGAGLVGADLRAVRGSDVHRRSGGVVVEVAGRRPRAVPVLVRYHPRLLRAAGSAGEALLVSAGSPFRKNVTAPLVASLAGGGGLPRLEVARLRVTWLAEVAGVLGLKAFMAAAGVSCSQRLGDLVAGLAEVPGPEAVSLLGGRAH
jgi:integrase